MTRVTLTEEYVLVETDDIDFSILRLAVQEHYKQVASREELPDEFLNKVKNDQNLQRL